MVGHWGRGPRALAAVISLALSALVRPGLSAAADTGPTPEQLEPEKLAASAGRAERQGSTLTLHGTNGQTAIFHSEDQCGDNGKPFQFDHCIKFVFLGYRPERHGSLVLAKLYESVQFFWISDATAKRFAIGGKPHFSPNGRRFAVVVPNEAQGFNGVQIWRWENQEATLEFDHQPTEYALYDFDNWKGDEAIDLKVATYINHKIAEVPAQLLKTASGWYLSGPVEASR